MNKKKINISFVLILAMFLLFSQVSTQTKEQSTFINPKISQYFDVTIFSDSELEDYSNSGSGTENDPFIIENSTYCFHIEDTSKSFVLKNIVATCSIYFDNVSNAQIENSQITGGLDAFKIRFSRNIILKNNIAKHGRNGGFNLVSVKNLIFENNQVNNYSYGISLDDVDFANIINNSVKNSLYGGIGIYYSKNATIVNNTSNENGGRGFYLSSVINSSIIGNKAFNNSNVGFFVSSSEDNLFSQNIANGNLGFDLKVQFSDRNEFVNNAFTSIYNPYIEPFIYFLIISVFYVIAILSTIKFEFSNSNKIKIIIYSTLIVVIASFAVLNYDISLFFPVVVLILLYEFVALTLRSFYVYYENPDEKEKNKEE